jgi:hypothetical protein
VTETAVGPEIHQSLDVHSDFLSEIPFHLMILIDDLTYFDYFGLSKLSCPLVPVDTCLGQYLLGRRTAYAVDIRQSYLGPFVVGQIDSSNSWQCRLL